MSGPRPITLLIAALGGEGGGVLTSWIVRAAETCDFPVQSTSIPGVAQRTGATTYYIEILPVKTGELGGKRPVLALVPGIGDIDIAVASELLEAGRTVANGFVTPERTFAIASTSRFYAMDEKIAMGDGRFDAQKLRQVITQNSKDALLIDMETLAKKPDALINAVMLGAIAGSGRLPIPVEAFEAAIRADGKAVESNLRGFHAGLDAARAKTDGVVEQDAKKPARNTAEALEAEIERTIPAAAKPIAIEGVRRLAKYQSIAYAGLYLERLAPFIGGDARLLTEIARHLAVRMSYEDVIRVAATKIAPERLARIAREELKSDGEPFTVHDFLKPGIEEMCQILPPFIARPILLYSAKKGWLGRVYFGMEINSTSISGYLRFLMLAKLRGLRPYGHRYKEEQQQIEAWLGLVAKAARLSPQIALEVAECARLIKGYGDTHARGRANDATIVQRVIFPVLAGDIGLAQAADAIASARTAALVDPEGESLAKCLAALDAGSTRVAAE
ncbi:MAG: indolepyruvate oxidoreductase subunit beta family protein [Pseudolabrys sp.]|nr:indolepyruvate oxidoreductase subunit beta family protein [Pseudolabrys sp.]